MAVFAIGGVIVSTGVLALTVIKGLSQREKTCYDCGKYGAEVANETGDREQGWEKGKEELYSEGIHYASTTLKNSLSFKKGFKDNYITD